MYRHSSGAVTCAYTHDAPARSCNASDLFLVYEGYQCGNCGAIYSGGKVIARADAIKLGAEEVARTWNNR